MVHNGCMPVPRPLERPSFGQRDSYRDILSDGYAQGRLDDAEFARRTEAAVSATSLARLEELIADLPRGGLPVPEERRYGHAEDRDVPDRDVQGRDVQGRNAQGSAGRRRGRTPLQVTLAVVTAAALVGITGGLIAGPFMAEAQQAGDQETEDASADGAERSSTEPSFAHDDVTRAFDLAADYEEVSRILVSGTTAQLHVPTEPGTTYDVVTVDQQGRVSTEPGGTYGETEPNARIDPSTIDPDKVAAMAVAAPDVYAETTRNDGLPASRLNLGVPGSGTEYAGVEPGSPVVRVTLDLGDYGDGGGTVTWTPDGEQIVEVRE